MNNHLEKIRTDLVPILTKIDTHRARAWAWLTLSLIITMLVEDALIALGLSAATALAVASPLVLIVLALAIVRSRRWGKPSRVLLGVVIFWLVRWPTYAALQNEAHMIEVWVCVGLFLIALVALVIYGNAHGESSGSKASGPITRTANSHLNSDGTPKVGYATQGAAQFRADLLAGKDGQPMNTYQCGDCPQWHVGHKN